MTSHRSHWYRSRTLTGGIPPEGRNGNVVVTAKLVSPLGTWMTWPTFPRRLRRLIDCVTLHITELYRVGQKNWTVFESLKLPYIAQYQCSRLSGKTRRQYDLLCVELEAKSYTLTRWLIALFFCIWLLRHYKVFVVRIYNL